MKVTNDMLAKYIKLSEKISKLNKERGDIRKAILENGSISTADYVATVEALKKERVAGKKELENFFGRQVLVENGLLQTYISQEVNVVEKSEALQNVG